MLHAQICRPKIYLIYSNKVYCKHITEHRFPGDKFDKARPEISGILLTG